MKSIELESKLLLDWASYVAIQGAGDIIEDVDQLNIYFDSPDWGLAEASATCRVRFESSGTRQLTLKIPEGRHLRNGHARAMEEYEWPLDELTEVVGGWSHKLIHIPSVFPPEAGKALDALGIEKLIRVGWSRNRRLILTLDNNIYLELDHLKLPRNRVIFEAEVESPNLADHERALERLKSITSNLRLSERSKFQRFRDAVTDTVDEGCSSSRIA